VPASSQGALPATDADVTSSRYRFPARAPGLEGLKDILRTMRSAFSDLDFSIKEQIADGDKVASRFEWTGTLEQEFLGYPPRDGAFGFVVWSSTGWSQIVSRTHASSWIPLG
jgi:predicted ester cyclase